MPSDTLLLVLAALTGLGIVAMTALTAWHGWLQFKLQELEHLRPPRGTAPTLTDPGPAAQTRIELADVKERLRRLEAIAAGVDL